MTHHILDFLRGALVHYGYWAVAATLLLENAGVPVPGESVLLLASFLAYTEHDLQVGLIILVGTVAATLGDNLGYFIGHRGGSCACHGRSLPCSMRWAPRSGSR